MFKGRHFDRSVIFIDLEALPTSRSKLLYHHQFSPAKAAFHNRIFGISRRDFHAKENALTEGSLDLRLRAPAASAEGVAGPQLRRFLPKQLSLPETCPASENIRPSGEGRTLSQGVSVGAPPHWIELIRNALPGAGILPRARYTIRSCQSRSIWGVRRNSRGNQVEMSLLA